MKKITAISAVLATVLAACNRNEINDNPGVVVINADSDVAATKVAFGGLNEGVRALSWNTEGEDIVLWEFVDNQYLQKATSTSFTIDPNDSKRGTFSVALPVSEGNSFDYVAIYPASADRAAKTDKSPVASYALSITATDMQKPSASGPDKDWMVMTARQNGMSAQPASLSLKFEHQTAYGRMTFKNFPLESGETITSITVTCPDGKYFTGRRWIDAASGEVTPYSATAQKNTFKIDPCNLSVNSTSFDVWFSVLPVELVSGETLNVTATTSKAVRVADIKLTKDLNFNKGEVSSFTINWANYVTTDKVLLFDFTCAPKEGWPTAQDWGESASTKGCEMTCTYAVGGVDYTFILKEPSFAQNGKIYWNETAKYFFMGKYRYLGFPVISGYALKTVKCTVGKQISGSAVAIMDHVYNAAAASDPDSYAVAAQAWNVPAGTVMTYEVNSTDATKQYYLYCKNPSGGEAVGSISLTYSPVSE